MCYLLHTYEQVNSIHSQHSIFQAGHLLTIVTTFIKYLSAACEILHLLADQLQLHISALHGNPFCGCGVSVLNPEQMSLL